MDEVELDLRGLKCPLPVMRTRKALSKRIAGAELIVATTDPMSAIDIPHMCREDGHELIAVDRPDARTMRFHIRGGVNLPKSP